MRKAMLGCGLGMLLGAASPIVAQSPSVETTYAAAIRARYVPLATVMNHRATLPERLARRVSVHLDKVPLQRALVEIATQARLGLSYGEEVANANQVVSLALDGATAAEALSSAVRGTAWIAMVTAAGQVMVVRAPAEDAVVKAGAIVGRVTDAKTHTVLAGATVVVEGTRHSATTSGDGRYRIAEVAPGTYTVRARYIGYAPGSASVTVSVDQEATADLALEKSAQRLDEVVTTGTVVPTEVKALPTPISVVTADEIQQQNLQRVDQIFRGQIPGVLAWDQGVFNEVSGLYVRGSSGINVKPTIKTFIDGVEMANPEYLALIDPTSIDRIEVTRGPQASTLYGAGALSGVMQIFTKHGQLGLTRPEITGKLSAGGVGGFDGNSTALQTDNALSVLGGGEKGSYNLGGTYRHTGAWLPFYGSTDWGVSAGGMSSQGPFTISGSARYADKTIDVPFDTRTQMFDYFSKPFYTTYDIREQTYGVTGNLQATRTWQHTLTLGYDQSYFIHDQTQPRFAFPDDSGLSTLGEHEAKLALLYHTDLSLKLGAAATAVLTAGINHDSYNFLSTGSFGSTQTVGDVDGFVFLSRSSWNTTGLFGQVQLNVADRLFLTGGLRGERNPTFGTNYGTAYSPRVGAAYVLGLGPASVKLRASYGESIRAPDPGMREGVNLPERVQVANPNLAPERQRGVDGGVEIYVGRASVVVSYYNQRAIDLIDYVQVGAPGPAAPLARQHQNVGKVKNVGWELEGHVPLGPVQLSGTYTIMNSTVQQLSPSYTGDYQVGDRLVGVPYTTAGATVTYAPVPRTTLTASMTHIGHWTETDLLTLYGVYFLGQPYRGSGRAYWMEYPTVTKFAVGVSQVVGKDLTAFVRAENVGNNLRSEQINVNIPVPRSVMVGANVR